MLASVACDSHPRHSWAELISTDPEALITQLAAYRKRHHPNDHRYLVVCGMRDEQVHAEWTEGRPSGPTSGPAPARGGDG
jgi:hypothetical protein